MKKLALVMAAMGALAASQALAAETLVVTGDTAGYVQALAADTGAQMWQVQFSTRVNGIAASVDGERIVVGTQSATYLLDGDGTLVTTLAFGVPGGTSFVPDNHPVAMSADGEWLVLAGTSGQVALYDWAGVQIWSAAFVGARSADIADDGSMVIAGGGSRVALFAAGMNGWDASDATPVMDDTATGGNVRIVSISSDGAWGVAGTSYVGGRVYSAAGFAVTLPMLPGIATAIISGDGRTVIVGDDDPGTSYGADVRIYEDGGNGWDSADATPACVDDPNTAGSEDVRALATTFDGSVVAAGGATVFAYLRILDDACNLLTASSFLNEPLSLAMSSDGLFTVAAGRGWAFRQDTGTATPAWTVPVLGGEYTVVALAGCLAEESLCEAVGAIVDRECPCAGPDAATPWANHGQYVSCVAAAAREALDNLSPCFAAMDGHGVHGCVVSERARRACPLPIPHFRATRAGLSPLVPIR